MAVSRFEHWSSVWASKRPSDVSWFEEESGTSLELVQRYAADRAARIIDVGGGASRLVDGLLAAGHENVTVLDVAASALEASKERLGAGANDVRWIAADVLSFTPERTYDLWHDRAMFHFLVNDDEIHRYRDVLSRAVPVGGIAIIATFAPDGPQRCSNLDVRRHDGASIVAALAPAVALIEELRRVHRTPWGAEQRFAWSVLRRV